MKYIIAFFVASFFFFSNGSLVHAQGVCNAKCDVNEDCAKGFRCYVGVCRTVSCPASPTCSCSGSQVTPVPTTTSTPRPATATPTPSPTPTLTPSPTMKATVSANLKRTPKTGFETWMLMGASLLLFVGGSSIATTERLFVQKGKSPEEIFSKKKQRSSVR